MASTILITGTSGFLGEHLIRRLLSDSTSFIISSDRFACPAHTLIEEHQGRVLLSPNDPSNERAELLAHRLLEARVNTIDAVVHCAAMSSFSTCETTPELAHRVNGEYTRQMCRLAELFDAYFLYISTDLVFDGNKIAPPGGFSEKDKPQATSVYGRTKLLGEDLIRDYVRRNGAILRASLLYGPPAGRTGGPLQWIFHAIAQGLPVRAFFDEWRTPLYVEDLTYTIQSVLTQRPLGLFHCGGPDRVNRFDFMLKLFEIFGFDLTLLKPTSRLEEPGPPRPEDVSLNSKKLSQQLVMQGLGYQEGLRRLFDRLKRTGNS